MEVIFILLPLALGIALFFLAAYVWAVRTGQFDDTTTPAYRILLDEETAKRKHETGNTERKKEVGKN